MEARNERIVDANLKDYFGSVDDEKLLTLVAIADRRVLKSSSDQSAQGQRAALEVGNQDDGEESNRPYRDMHTQCLLSARKR